MKRATDSQVLMNKLGIALLVALVVVSGVSATNYVRWNNLLTECVYYYDTPTSRAHCFVPEENCETMDPYNNEYKDADASTCDDVRRTPLSLEAKNVTVSEGDSVKMDVNCTGDKTMLRYTGKMIKGYWKTGYNDAGTYPITVTCTDSHGKSESRRVSVTVLDKNRPPSITNIGRAK